MDNRYQINLIKATDTQEVIQLAKEVFGVGASLFISKKKMWGYVASDGKKIVGAVLLNKASHKEGYLSWIFVSEEARGHKLASKLINKGFEALDNAGLHIQFALVRDDNTASWNMFYKAGYKILPLYQTLFNYPVKGIFKRINYMLVSGYSIWVKDDAKKNSPVYPKFPLIRSLLGALFIGASIALFGLRDLNFLMITIIMVLSVTLIRILVAYPIARTYGKVRFMPSQGGYLLSVVLALLTTSWWPTFGFFVPKEDTWKDSDFKANIGKQAMATWMALNGMFITSAILFNDIFVQGLNVFLLMILIYQLIPSFEPFDGFDGAKVMRWNKGAYYIGLFITLLTVGFTYSMVF